MGRLGRRQRPAWQPPADDLDLSTFPSVRLEPGTALYRAHAARRGPWWFCSDLACRFDLPAPQGACYLALDIATAVRERLGEMVRLGVVPRSVVGDFEVSIGSVPQATRVADIAHAGAASFGVTRELSTATPYAVSQAWAAALAERFDGIIYQSRFTTGRDQHAVVLFGRAGEPDWIADETVPGAAACAAAELQIMSSRPRYDRLDVIDPIERRPSGA